jgi:hypothetical protein
MVWPYYAIFTGIHNSLKYNSLFILFLIPISLLYPFKFIAYLYKGKYSYLLLLIIPFFIIDLFINYPINKYKFDTYCLLVIILYFSFLIKLFNRQKVNWFITYILFVWLLISIIEFYLRWKYPILFEEVWRGLTLQSAIKGDTFEVKQIYGLGISTQSNVTAIISLIFILIFNFQKSGLLNKTFKYFLIFFCLSLMLFMLSLTAILGVIFSYIIYTLREKIGANIHILFIFICISLIFLYPLIFSLGDIIGFSANKTTQNDYFYEFFTWPAIFFLDNPLLITLGLYNDISNAPLENKYFNLLLTNGFLISCIFFIILFRFYNHLLVESKHGGVYALRFILFSNLVISYFHISYLPHVSTLILFASIFVYAISPVVVTQSIVQSEK